MWDKESAEMFLFFKKRETLNFMYKLYKYINLNGTKASFKALSQNEHTLRTPSIEYRKLVTNAVANETNARIMQNSLQINRQKKEREERNGLSVSQESRGLQDDPDEDVDVDNIANNAKK